MALAAPSQSHGATLGTVGVHYGEGLNWGLGRSWLSAYVAYRRALSGVSLAMEAGFNGVPGATFEAERQSLPRNVGGIVGTELNTQANACWSRYLDAYDEMGSEGAHQAEAGAGMRVAV